MKFRFLSLILLVWACCNPLRAQINLPGTDPDSLHWRRADIASYRLLYPEDLSQQVVTDFASKLLYFQGRAGASAGMAPGQYQWGRTPIILHNHSVFPNGSVTWAPKRMDLYTLPDPYGPEASSWSTQLAVHESRHLAQMQFSYRAPFRWGHVLLGEIWGGALAGIYPNQALLEGDAVVAETALTPAGRGRSADFLRYMYYAFDQGDWRNFYRWRYGSYRHYTPDWYRVGYLTVAGARTCYDDPLFTARYFEQVRRHPLRIGSLPRTLRQASGKKWKASFREIENYFHESWLKESAERAPFVEGTPWQESSSFPRNDAGSVILGDQLYTLRSSYVRSRRLIRISLSSGQEEELTPFASTTSPLSADPERGRLYWSEARIDRRWSLEGASLIRYWDIAEGKSHTLSPKGRYFNPQADSSGVWAVEYTPEGLSAAVLLSATDGHILRQIPAPESGEQLTEVCPLDGRLYALAVDDAGFRLLRWDEDTWQNLLTPLITKIQQLHAFEGGLEWVSDLDGSEELYRFDPSTGELWQMTSLRYGGTDFCRSADQLYYSAQQAQGMALFHLPLAALEPRPVRWGNAHRYPIAEQLSAQENALLAENSQAFPSLAPVEGKPYRKGAHLLKIHSWAPLYLDNDAIESLSGDLGMDEAAPGATLLFQNPLGTSYGSAAYEAVYRDNEAWRHAVHLKYSYSGRFPVIETRLDIGGRDARQTSWQEISWQGLQLANTDSHSLSQTYASFRIRSYVPLNFSGGGVSRGLIPDISYQVSTDRFDTRTRHLRYLSDYLGQAVYAPVTGVSNGHNVLTQQLHASVRGYILLPQAASQSYPSLGIGGEIGWSGHPGMDGCFSPTAYLYLYGYLPGIRPQQGLRMSLRGEHSLRFGEALGNRVLLCTPRGFDAEADDFLARRYQQRIKWTADYALPIYVGDISFLSPLIYIRHFVLTPHLDLMSYGNFRSFSWTGVGGIGKIFPSGRAPRGFAAPLYSAGIECTARTANLLWLPFDGAIGVRWDYNGGLGKGADAFRILHEASLSSRTKWGLIFQLNF